MEQRSLRLGDIVDDYCPRERRITNHAVVAMVGDDVKQTRCTTCEAEHVYKGARLPRKRPKDGDDAGLNLAGGQLVHPRATGADPQPVGIDQSEPVSASAEFDAAPSAPNDADTADDDRQTDDADEAPVDGWLAHRPLIRATLPKTDGEPPPARPIPEFTMHQRHARGGRSFRQPQGWRGAGGGSGGGNGHGGNFSRSGGEPDGNRAPGQGGGKPGRHRGGRHRRRR